MKGKVNVLQRYLGNSRLYTNLFFFRIRFFIKEEELKGVKFWLLLYSFVRYRWRCPPLRLEIQTKIFSKGSTKFFKVGKEWFILLLLLNEWWLLYYLKIFFYTIMFCSELKNRYVCNIFLSCSIKYIYGSCLCYTIQCASEIWMKLVLHFRSLELPTHTPFLLSELARFTLSFRI